MKLSPSEWRRRRRVLYLTLAVLTGCLVYIISFGEDTAVNKEAVLPLVLGIVSLVGTYAFAAAWDDKNFMNAVTKQQNYGFSLDPSE
jgi:hypothetical protein